MNGTRCVLLAGALALLVGGVAGAAEAPVHKMVGAAKCKTCHSTPKSGQQFPKWKASAHARAFTDLAKPAAKAIAKKKGIADPQKSQECLDCHVTAQGKTEAEKAATTFKPEDGVSCEACHGPGGDYWKMATMKDLYAKKLDPAKVGLVVPTEATCTQCHNSKSPTFKGFDYKTYSAKIAHPVPAKS